MTITRTTKKFAAIVLSVVMLALALFVPGAISADTANVVAADYTALADAEKLSIDYYSSTLKMYDGVGLVVKDGALVADADWLNQLNTAETTVTDKTGAYAVYNIEPATAFTATFTSATAVATAPTVYLSENGVKWTKAIPTVTDNSITLSAVETLKATFVKIVWPMAANAATACGLESVSYTAAPVAANEEVINYGTLGITQTTDMGNGETDTNVLMNRGVWKNNGKIMLLASGVVAPDWQTVNNATTANSYDGHLIYKVQPGTRFAMTVTSNRATDAVATALGYANVLDYTIEFYGSLDGKTYTKIDAAYTNTLRYANNNLNGDAVRSTEFNFIVPSDVVYLKAKFPQTQNLNTLIPDGATDPVYAYAGNDLISINKVEFSRLKYDYVQYKKDSADYVVATDSPITNANKANYGISEYNGTNIVSRATAGAGIDIDWNCSYYNRNGSVTYDVEPGTAFYAGFVTVWNLPTYAAKKDFVLKVDGFDPVTQSWVEDVKDIVLTNEDVTGSAAYPNGIARGGDYSVKYTLTASENTYSKLKFTWPNKYNDQISTDSLLTIAEVAFTEPQPDTRTVYDYTDLTALPRDDAQGIGAYIDSTIGIGKVGMHGLVSGKVSSTRVDLWRGATGAFFVGRDAIVNQAPKTAEYYADYNVTPGTKFTATLMVSDNASWGKPYWESLSANQGEIFEFTLLTSEDGYVWTEAASTGDRTGVFDFTITVPDNANYVRVRFPQDGNSNGKNKDDNNDENGSACRMFNDMASLNAVKFQPVSKGNFGTYFNFNTMGENNLSYNDLVYTGLYLYDYKGVEIKKLSNAMVYLGANEAYAASATADTKPYVTYKVMGGTDFLVATSKDETAIAPLGADFNVTVFESADGTTWTPVTANLETDNGIGLGTNDTYTFKTATTTNYVKVVLPHKGKVGDVSGHDSYGIAAIGLSLAKYGEYDAYGNNTYGQVNKYMDLERCVFTAADFADYDLHDAGIASIMNGKGSGLQVRWEYLEDAKNVPKAYAVFNTVPGTAFQAEVTFNKTAFDAIAAAGVDVEPRLYVSTDNSNWFSFDYRVAKITASKTRSGRAAFVLTSDALPANATFVKVELPFDTDVFYSSNGAWQWCGNDLCEIPVVSFTKGEAQSPYSFTIDESKYGKTIDFADVESDIKLEAQFDLDVIGMDYSKGYKMILPGYDYFGNSGSETRMQPEVVVPVKEGTAFFTEIQYRPNIFNSFLEGSYDAKLYFSKDGQKWTDVTTQYRTRSGAGDIFALCERYDIAALPAGVKYVKIQMPNDRNYIGYTTDKGVKLVYMGNDYLGIRKLFYTPAAEPTYKHVIDHTEIYNKYTEIGMPEAVTEEVDKVLGLYDYTEEGLVNNYYNAMVNGEMGKRYLMKVTPAYLLGRKLDTAPYVVYNVVPGTAFRADMFGDDVNASMADPSLMFKVYWSETGEDGTWNLFTSGYSNYTERKLSYVANMRFAIDNVGAKTNFIKIEYPQMGDFAELYPGKTNSVGDAYYGIEKIYATLVTDPIAFEKKESTPTIFLDPNQQIVNRIPVTVEVPFVMPLWGWIAIGVGAAVVLAGATLLIIFLVKKKKKNEEETPAV